MSGRGSRGRTSHAPPIQQSIMLVDDHPLWRETLRKVIDREGIGTVVAEASDGDEAVDLARSVRFDLVVMDMSLPTMGGAEATRRLRMRHPDLKILVLSSFEARASVIDAVRAGASGYLLKTAGAHEVAEAIRRVSDGELVFPSRLANVVLEEFRRLSDEAASRTTARVAVAGDSAIHRQGLANLLREGEFEVVAVGVQLADLKDQLIEDPDVWILDFHATSERGFVEANHIRSQYPDAHLLVLTQEVRPSQPLDVLATGGGIGILLRDRVADLEHLADAIRRVAAGESVVDPNLASAIVGRPSDSTELSELTAREREVLALMAEGRSNQAICDRLHLSGKTLEKHIRAIFTKLHLDDSADGHRRVLAVVAYLRSL